MSLDGCPAVVALRGQAHDIDTIRLRSQLDRMP